MRGLYNFGNTCYFNAAIQTLAHCPPLSIYLFENEIEFECEITQEYKKVAKQLFHKDDTSPVDPNKLLTAFRNKFPEFNNLNQHDSQEVIIKLIDVFEKSIGKDLITKIFNGQIIQETQWMDGFAKNSIRKTQFTVIDLIVNEKSNLKELIKINNAPSEISDYKDEHGNVFNAVKTNSFSKLPLIVSFSFSMYENKYPITVPLIFGGKKLFALIIHQGSSHGGHYAMIVKRFEKWFMKDDTQVHEFNMNGDEITGSFYMAFYR